MCISKNSCRAISPYVIFEKAISFGLPQKNQVSPVSENQTAKVRENILGRIL
jgi:hypothetical protein